MNRKTVVITVLIIVVGLFFVRETKILALPIDCMPTIIGDGIIEESVPVFKQVWGAIFKTKCVSW